MKMSVPADGKINKVVESLLPSQRTHISTRAQTAQHLRNFEIKDLRSKQGNATIEQSPLDTGGNGGAQKNFDQGRRVNHDHRMSRSIRIMSAGDTLGFTGVRVSSRSRISATVGLSADCRISTNR